MPTEGKVFYTEKHAFKAAWGAKLFVVILEKAEDKVGELAGDHPIPDVLI